MRRLSRLRGRALWLAPFGLLLAWSCSSDERDFGHHGDVGFAGAAGAAEGVEGGAPGTGTASGGAAPAAAGEPGSADGGVGGQQQADGLRVVSTAPEDAAVGVERDLAVDVTFSSELDPETVTVDTFSVIGPSGPVSGQLDVSGATASFTPSAPWSLLADYTVTLSPESSTPQGAPLEAAHTFTFQSRDGVFRKPERVTLRPEAWLGESRKNGRDRRRVRHRCRDRCVSERPSSLA